MSLGDPCPVCHRIPCQCCPTQYWGPTPLSFEDQLRASLIAGFYTSELRSILDHAAMTGNHPDDRTFDGVMEEALYLTKLGMEAYQRMKYTQDDTK